MAELVGAVTATARRWHVDTLPSARFLQVEDELVEVEALYIADSIITVRRGIEGTTAASHDAGTVLESPVFGAGVGGGESVLSRVTVTLTDAQIKSTPGGNSRFLLVAAPGAGKAFHVLGGVGILRVSAGAYTNIDITDSTCGLLTGSFAATVRLTNSDFSGAFGDIVDRILFFSQPSEQGTGTQVKMVPARDLSSAENKPINLEIYNNLGALTGGNVANELQITVWYDTVDLP